MDLISQLPEAILHYILSFLPSRDVARSSVLSKTWRSISSSCPTVNLFQKYFHESDFQDYMKLSLQNCAAQKLGVRRFKLYITTYDHEDLGCLIDQWLNLVSNSRLEEVYIEIPKTSDEKVCYNLPSGILLLASNKLTTLSLSGCGLDDYCCSYSIISLPNLQNLALQHMDVDGIFVQNLLSSCPLLEHIIINYCHKLTSLEVSSSLQRLRTLRVEFCFNLGKIVVGTGPSLEFLRFCDMPCEMIKLAATNSLKSLSLSFVPITSEWLQNQIAKFVGLEDLYLHLFPNLKTIKFSSPKLRRLEIIHCLKLGAATKIHAPNLREVNYTNTLLPFYSIRSSNLAKATFNFSLGDRRRVWLRKLNQLQLFLTTSHIQDFKVSVQYFKSGHRRVITTKLSDSMLPILKEIMDKMTHQGLSVRISSMSSSEWFRCLTNGLWQKMVVATYDHESSDFLSAFHEEVSKERAKAEASRNTNGSMIKCNGIYLDEVEIGSINWAQEENEEEDWILLLRIYESAFDNITTMNLKWTYRRGSICPGTGCRRCRE